MKKSSKYLVLIGVATIAIGISGLFGPTNKINKNIGIQEAKAYNHNTVNALDNVFIQDNNLILPFIFDNKDQATTLDIRTKFARAGLTIRSMSTENVGTGTQITVNENTNTYNVLIYGDVTGDGVINLIDVQNIILHYLGRSTLTGLHAMAGNVSNNDNNINLIDAQRVILFYLGNLNTGLVVQEPVSSGSTNPMEPTNPTNPSNPNEPTNPSNPTTPTEDPVSKIEHTLPSKKEYIIGDLIDLTGGKIEITYASGKVETVNMQISMIKGAYNMNQLGDQSVTISYSKANFSTTYSFTIKNKDVSTIIASKDGKDGPINTAGICYQPVKFILKSGEKEENINIDNLTFDISITEEEDNSKIKRRLSEEENITIEKNLLQDGSIEVSFMAKIAGPYTITPKVGAIIGQEILIKVKEDESVNKIEILPMPESNTMTFIQDKATKVEVKFFHVYPGENGEEKAGREFEIEKGIDISKIASATLTPKINIATLEDTMENEYVANVRFLNGDSYLLPDTKSGDTSVKYASIKSSEAGEFILVITINDKVNDTTYTHTENIEIKVNEESKTSIEVNAEKDEQGNNIIRLYKSKNDISKNDKAIVYEYQNYIYTLIPISKIDTENNETTTKLKVKDIYQLGGSDDGKISLMDNVMYNLYKNSDGLSEEELSQKLNCTTSSIDIKAFRNEKDEQTGENTIKMIDNPSDIDEKYSNSEIDYIGIALKLNEMETGLNSIIVSYEGQETRLEIK